MQSLQRFPGTVLFGRSRQSQAVNVYVPFRNPQCSGTVEDPLGNGKPVGCLFGNAVFVQRQPDNCGTVFLDQRQDVLQGSFFAVDGVDNGLAVVHPQSRLHDRRNGGVQLQRCAADRLQRLDCADHHALFVNARHAHVYVQQVGTGIYLLYCLIQDVVHVVCLQCRLEPLLAGGVDAFADNAWLVDQHHFGSGADCRRNLDVFPPGDLCFFQQIVCGFDVFRRGAAAAAVNRNAQLCKLHHCLCEFRRVYQIFTGDRIRQSGVGLYHQRQRCPLCHFFHNGKEFVRTQGAVHAHRIGSQSLQRHCRRSDGTAGKGAEIRLKGHGADHRLVGVFLCRQQCRLGFVQVGHGFDDDQVCVLSGEDFFTENVVGFFKCECAQRFQKLSDRTDVQSHLGVRAGTGFSGTGNAGRDEFLHGIAGFRHFVPVCSERVGVDDVRPHSHELFLCGNDAFRFGDVVHLRQCTYGHAALLQHGTHAAV